MDGIRWSVLSHEHHDHSTDWYWGLGLAALAGVAASIFFSNILLALILALGAISIAILAVRGPREHEVFLHERGITIDGTLYRYPSLQSFWVHVEELPDELAELYEPRVNLMLATTGYLHPRLTLPLENLEHGQMVREYLLNFVEEEEQAPHFSEHLAELFGL